MLEMCKLGNTFFCIYLVFYAVLLHVFIYLFIFLFLSFFEGETQLKKGTWMNEENFYDKFFQ